MQNDQLRTACEERVRRLELPHRFGTQQLVAAVAALRGKPIILRSISTLGTVDAPCGVRVETEEADYLFYEEGTSALHRLHIMAHELSHIACDHPGSVTWDASALTTGISPTLIMRMSGRTSYTTDDEREAEMMATIIRQRIYHGHELPPSQPDGAAERWEAVFARDKRSSRR